jgi:hypothetical protein
MKLCAYDPHIVYSKRIEKQCCKAAGLHYFLRVIFDILLSLFVRNYLLRDLEIKQRIHLIYLTYTIYNGLETAYIGICKLRKDLG